MGRSMERLQSERVERFDDAFHLFLIHYLRDGKRKDFTMNLFADAVSSVVPFAISLLLMWRNRIVNHRFDAFPREIFTQTVTLKSANGIDVPNVLQGVGRL